MDKTHIKFDCRLAITCKVNLPDENKRKYRLKRFEYERPAVLSDLTCGDWWAIISHITQNEFQDEFTIQLPSGRYTVNVRATEPEDAWELGRPTGFRRNNYRQQWNGKTKDGDKYRNPIRDDVMKHCKCKDNVYSKKCPLHEVPNITVGFPDGSIRKASRG